MNRKTPGLRRRWRDSWAHAGCDAPWRARQPSATERGRTPKTRWCHCGACRPQRGGAAAILLGPPSRPLAPPCLASPAHPKPRRPLARPSCLVRRAPWARASANGEISPRDSTGSRPFWTSSRPNPRWMALCPFRCPPRPAGGDPNRARRHSGHPRCQLGTGGEPRRQAAAAGHHLTRRRQRTKEAAHQRRRLRKPSLRQAARKHARARGDSKRGKRAAGRANARGKAQTGRGRRQSGGDRMPCAEPRARAQSPNAPHRRARRKRTTEHQCHMTLHSAVSETYYGA